MSCVYYSCIFCIALVFTGIYIFIWNKHFDVNFTIVFSLVPISCLGYCMTAFASTLDSAVIAMKIAYIGGCFLQLFIALCILNMCQIDIPNWGKVLLYVICSICYLSVLSIGYSDIFYRNISFEIINGSGHLFREYGTMHTIFYIIVCMFFIIGLSAIIYSWFQKRQVPRRILCLLIIPDVICMLCFFIGRRIIEDIDIVPLGYCIAEFMFLLIAYRMNLYNVSDTVIDSMVQERGIGYVSFDFQFRYLGSNEIARYLVPELNLVAVDEKFGARPSEQTIWKYMDNFRLDNSNNSFIHMVRDEDKITGNDKIYKGNVNYLYDGKRKRGYIVTFTDDTANQKYIRLLDTYNENLKKEVDNKTRHIVEMHDNLIMSLAMMVESRDNSTGGHIKRTSEGVRILVDEIIKSGSMSLSEEFCRNVVKAAPMHDLGKIAVDDAILRKPGRFTPEEFEKMKHHAAEGARVIHDILLNTEDDSFKIIAENVAHYHHERWDGSGYPDGLLGEKIPLEARIMAIADVYDALVSKRVYKEAFDFKKADVIITEGMGTQFDPMLKKIYENARPRLEMYYGAMAADSSAAIQLNGYIESK